MANENTLHILLVEDDADLRNGVSEFLRTGGFEVSVAGSGEEALEFLRGNPTDLLVTDMQLPGIDGNVVIAEALSVYPELVPIVITGHSSVGNAVQAMKTGAYDYVSKPFQLTELRAVIDHSIARLNAKQQDGPAKREVTQRSALESIIGKSEPMQSIFDVAESIAGTNSTVLITGETGTGKEMIAKAIHNLSSRRDQKMVSINCGAIPENLLESELFGHVKGAFTGAHQTRVGRFEQAHKGTIFLDEIGNMSVSLQVKLLRVLQEREFERVGGLEKIKIDVRIIAATSSNLKDMVARNEFRSDLFYRLNVIPMRMPSLRERREDVSLLATHFIAKYCDRADVETKTIAQEAMKMLMNYNWPGNVRELENSIERAVAMIGPRNVIMAKDLPDEVQQTGGNLFISEIYIPDEGVNFNTEVSQIERKLILESLKKAGGNRAEAAQLLQLKRTTLIEKLRRLNLSEEPETVSA